ncbi:terminase small subunit [Compostimonas suwonensis]|uniref:Terminase small subunit actinomycetes phage-type domain-containing protein n=1 Tax=Compostimonas suwonensis TaxID=1048394 RepID=A0A2M9BW77_9MICO|nr:hypothetical protein [Compostimonas suwonensis]PJJ62179.1 hypothetical protein CLV54_1976 [Compostimonas suwonensis]
MREQSEERRAKQREYSRAHRERKRAAEREAVAAALASTEPPGPLSEALDAAIAAMKWLVPSDGALVALAREQARYADGLNAIGTAEARSRGLRFMVVLQRTLADLGGTPRVRMQLELRSARAKEALQAQQVKRSDNVTSIRPAKRRR